MAHPEQLNLFPESVRQPVRQGARRQKQHQKQRQKQHSAETVLGDYRVRESKRAKHVSIKVSVEGEVEVVVPPRFDRAQLPEILERRKAWILKTRSRLINAAEETVENWQVDKPENIVFRWQSSTLDEAVTDEDTESWSVQYQPVQSQNKGQKDKITCIPALNNKLTLQGNTDSTSLCQSVLRKWLAHYAHKNLAPWLRQLGYELDLPCRRISVRGQKTIWASCSNQKDISLNYKLLFLPHPLVRYVLVHELCHTVHMNHSTAFWALVESKMPDYEHWDQALKKGWRYVPRWVEKK